MNETHGMIVPPSTILVPLPISDAAAEGWVSHRLDRNYPGWRKARTQRPDNDLTGDVPWMLASELPGFPRRVFIWPEPMEELPEEVWWVSTDILDEEREIFEQCAFGLTIETALAGADPRELWRRQVILALSLGMNAPFFYDDNAMRLLSRAAAESVAEIPTPPSAREMLSMHAVFDEKDEERLWMHTHGLARACVPNLETFGIRLAQRSTAAQLMGIVAERLMDEKAKVGDCIPVGPDLAVELVPLETALDELQPGDLGGGKDRDNNHVENRFVLAAPARPRREGLSFFSRPRRSLCIDGLLGELEARDLIYYSEAETERMAYQARYRWPLFLALWRHHERPDWKFLVKAPFETAGGETVEHLWFEAKSIAPDRIEAELVNEPFKVPGLVLGRRYSIRPEIISDWSVSTEEGAYDPGNAARLAARAGIQVLAPKPVH